MDPREPADRRIVMAVMDPSAVMDPVAVVGLVAVMDPVAEDRSTQVLTTIGPIWWFAVTSEGTFIRSGQNFQISGHIDFP